MRLMLTFVVMQLLYLSEHVIVPHHSLRSLDEHPGL